jgi:hypothetical protein
VRVRVEEGKPRLVSGEFGYLSDGGLTFKAEWSHRNFYGKARLLTVSLVSQTGIWRSRTLPTSSYAASVSLTQRGVLGKRVSLITAPYIDYRDDYRDRSASLGVDATLLYVRDSWIRTASLKYGISARGLGLPVRLGRRRRHLHADPAGARFDTARRTSIQRVDAGDDARPAGSSVAAAAPAACSGAASRSHAIGGVEQRRVQPRRSDARRCKHPLREGRSSGRAPASDASGRSCKYPPRQRQPRGCSAISDTAASISVHGGRHSDVRGWPSQLLGPKTPDLLPCRAGADSGTVRADRYVPFGGQGALERQLASFASVSRLGSWLGHPCLPSTAARSGRPTAPRSA